MTIDKVQCDSCSVFVLESTKNRSGGLCVPCFMKRNHGFRPTELESLNRRGLTDKAIEWKEILRLGKPNERDPIKAQKLNQNYSEIYMYLEDFFLSRTPQLKANEILKLLSESEKISNKEVKKLISRVEAFVIELVSTQRNV